MFIARKIIYCEITAREKMFNVTTSVRDNVHFKKECFRMCEQMRENVYNETNIYGLTYYETHIVIKFNVSLT